jgi:hypothetical protein
MPLMKYFGFVGSSLVLLLLVKNWLLPEPTAEPIHSSIVRPSIRISSIESPPERVVFDTNMPNVAPPPIATLAVQPPQSAFTFEQVTPGVLPTFSTVAQVAPKKPITLKRDPSRVTLQKHFAAMKNYPVREAELNAKPPIKTTLLDDIAGRFGQLFKVN